MPENGVEEMENRAAVVGSSVPVLAWVVFGIVVTKMLEVAFE